jgi:hypothetical protein
LQPAVDVLNPHPPTPHPFSRPLPQSATNLPGIQKVLSLKGPLEAMMGELSANLPAMLTQGSSQQQAGATVHELPDGAYAAAALALPAPQQLAASPQLATSPPQQQYAQLYQQQYQQFAAMQQQQAEAPALPARHQPLKSPHTPHDARAAASLGGAPGSGGGRLAPGTPATAPGSGGLKGSAGGGLLAPGQQQQQLPAPRAAGSGPGLDARHRALLDLSKSELPAAH